MRVRNHGQHPIDDPEGRQLLPGQTADWDDDYAHEMVDTGLVADADADSSEVKVADHTAESPELAPVPAPTPEQVPTNPPFVAPTPAPAAPPEPAPAELAEHTEPAEPAEHTEPQQTGPAMGGASGPFAPGVTPAYPDSSPSEPAPAFTEPAASSSAAPAATPSEGEHQA